MTEDKYKDYLIKGIEQLKLNFVCNENKVNQLLQYLKLLDKWNKTYNLTAITNIEDMINFHLLDGLSILPYLGNIDKIRDIIDVGSGMGVPGVIIAICYPQFNVTVLDSNSKKTAFLQQVAIELKLKNLIVKCQKVEKYIPLEKFDIVVSRAFAASNVFINLTKHLVKDSGVIIAMKSNKVEIEVLELPRDCIYELINVSIPKIDVSRFLLKMWGFHASKKNNSSS
ncbi:MAG TPA: 16S rRNA (guanine(527)-N(7))-methyltransferase RsmG [Burkholderiales bacterium]|nr:16S rRNA (guanine(527)-N(7))-methyltransferase RsmG [Burkholderiales bacterium]